MTADESLRQRVEVAFADVRDRVTEENMRIVALRLRAIAAATGLPPPLDKMTVEQLRLWLDDWEWGISGPMRVWELAEADGP